MSQRRASGSQQPSDLPAVCVGGRAHAAPYKKMGSTARARLQRCSRKHLATRFREHVGLPPKLVTRMLRFRHAVDLMLSSPKATIAEVAATCGYYDQAHLDRDFRDFAATTPTAYVADLREPVTFVQDAAAAAS